MNGVSRSGLGGYLLAIEVTGSRGAAVFAGFAFGFSALPHLECDGRPEHRDGAVHSADPVVRGAGFGGRRRGGTRPCRAGLALTGLGTGTISSSRAWRSWCSPHAGGDGWPQTSEPSRGRTAGPSRPASPRFSSPPSCFHWPRSRARRLGSRIRAKGKRTPRISPRTSCRRPTSRSSRPC